MILYVSCINVLRAFGLCSVGVLDLHCAFAVVVAGEELALEETGVVTALVLQIAHISASRVAQVCRQGSNCNEKRKQYSILKQGAFPRSLPRQCDCLT
jgi:hypothetical protein